MKSETAPSPVEQRWLEALEEIKTGMLLLITSLTSTYNLNVRPFEITVMAFKKNMRTNFTKNMKLFTVAIS